MFLTMAGIYESWKSLRKEMNYEITLHTNLTIPLNLFLHSNSNNLSKRFCSKGRHPREVRIKFRNHILDSQRDPLNLFAAVDEFPISSFAKKFPVHTKASAPRDSLSSG